MKFSGQSVLKAALKNKNSLQPISVIIGPPKKTTLNNIMFPAFHRQIDR